MGRNEKEQLSPCQGPLWCSADVAERATCVSGTIQPASASATLGYVSRDERQAPRYVTQHHATPSLPPSEPCPCKSHHQVSSTRHSGVQPSTSGVGEGLGRAVVYSRIKIQQQKKQKFPARGTATAPGANSEIHNGPSHAPEHPVGTSSGADQALHVPR